MINKEAMEIIAAGCLASKGRMEKEAHWSTDGAYSQEAEKGMTNIPAMGGFVNIPETFKIDTTSGLNKFRRSSKGVEALKPMINYGMF